MTSWVIAHAQKHRKVKQSLSDKNFVTCSPRLEFLLNFAKIITKIYTNYLISFVEFETFKKCLKTEQRVLHFSRSELLIESEARSAESSEARSAESRSDVAPNARRRAQGDANLGQGLFIYLYIWMCERH